MSCGQYMERTFMDFHGISIHAVLDSNQATLGDVCRGLSWPIFWPWAFVSSSWMAMSLNCFFDFNLITWCALMGVCMHVPSHHRPYTVISCTGIGQAATPLPPKTSHQVQGPKLYMQHARWK